jgi:mono/diheme cytochrome c family protein
MRTGKDFHDSTTTHPQQMLVMPWHVYRFLAREDLQSIYAFLRRIPPVRHAVRETFVPPFPLPPLPPPALVEDDAGRDPAHAERGLSLLTVFSTGRDAATFVRHVNRAVARLTPSQRAQVGRGSYVVNALADCSACHTDGNNDGMFDGGLLPGSVAVNTTAYLAGGVDVGSAFGQGRLLARNLTPDPATGLTLTVEQFIATVRFGADFRLPGGSLRIPLHFPAEFRLTHDDLQAIYAYLHAIPAVGNTVELIP